MKLLVIRHGETIGNSGKVIQGNIGGELSPRGILQAKAVAKFLRESVAKVGVTKIGHVYSSDLNRGSETGGIIATTLNLPLTKTFALREGSLGHLEGRPWSEFLSYDWTKAGLDMETIDYQIARLNLFLSKLYLVHKDQTVVLVTHSGTIKGLVAISRNTLIYPAEVRTSNCGLCVFNYDGTKLISEVIDVTDFLPADLLKKRLRL